MSNRRDFLKVAGAVTASAALPLSATEHENPMCKLRMFSHAKIPLNAVIAIAPPIDPTSVDLSTLDIRMTLAQPAPHWNSLPGSRSFLPPVPAGIEFDDDLLLMHIFILPKVVPFPPDPIKTIYPVNFPPQDGEPTTITLLYMKVMHTVVWEDRTPNKGIFGKNFGIVGKVLFHPIYPKLLSSNPGDGPFGDQAGRVITMTGGYDAESTGNKLTVFSMLGGCTAGDHTSYAPGVPDENGPTAVGKFKIIRSC